MAIRLKYVEGLPVEGPELDEAALAEEKRIADLVLREYEEAGTLDSKKVCEAVTGFEAYAHEHIK